jgi:Domain of unknown function (DUF1772)
MDEVWATAMVVSGGLFAGALISIAVERVPAWRRSDISDFRVDFAQTVRRVDRLQPALLSISLVSTIGFAIAATSAARTLATFAAGGFLLILLGSLAWLVPIQRTLKSDSELPPAAVEGLRTHWLDGHLFRTVAAVALFALIVVATII